MGTVTARGSDERYEHETLLIRRGPRSDVTAIVAVHSTSLGPALGGCRMWSYATLQAAVTDALRLSRAMTLKAAVAGLPLGGGKAVICLPKGADRPRGALRAGLLRDFAESIDLLAGSYITAEDVGTTSADMARIGEWTEHVVGRPTAEGGGGDPGSFTAAGVEAALRACLRHVFGSRSLAHRSVAVVGVGSVGGALARSLAHGGARLVLADIDPAKRALARELGATWMSPAGALRARVDAVAPCALGGAIDAQLLPELRCRVICGAANNQLANDELAEQLADAGILYAPDFVVNAAGLVNVSLELSGYDAEQARRGAARIETVLDGVLDRAQSAGATPLRCAIDLAHERLRLARLTTPRPSRETGAQTDGRAPTGDSLARGTAHTGSPIHSARRARRPISA